MAYHVRFEVEGDIHPRQLPLVEEAARAAISAAPEARGQGPLVDAKLYPPGASPPEVAISIGIPRDITLGSHKLHLKLRQLLAEHGGKATIELTA